MRWLVLVLVVLTLAAPAAMAQVPVPSDGRNQIVTSGQSRIDVMPDQAMVSFGVSIQRPGAADAWTETSRIANQILARLQALGVRKEQLRTTGVQLFPIYAPSGPPTITGYRGSYTVLVTLDDLNLIGRVIDGAIEAGANGVGGISFGLRDATSARVRLEALALAVREAREKAQTIAQAAGIQLRGIERIQEGGVIIQPPILRALPGPVPPGAQQAPTQIEPGMTTVTAQVTAVFGF